MSYPMPSDYVSAMRADTRDLDMFLAVGVNIDQTSADDYTGAEAGHLAFGNPAQLVDAVYDIEEGTATFEAYGIPSAVSAGMVAPPIEPTTYPPEWGFWSDVISDANGAIDWTITISLSAEHTSAFTLFTRQVSILDATIEFKAEGTVTASGAMVADLNSVKFEDAAKYDTIIVHVTRISAPYRHVRISEIEFGASKTFNKSSLMDAVSLVEECDPLMTSIPLYELDFTVINVLGEWDPDNPLGSFGTMPATFPVQAGVSCYQGDTMWTVPLGRYVIAEKKANETKLSVVCYDPRKSLQDAYGSWSLKASESLGTWATAILTEMHIPHIVDDEIFTMMPVRDYASKDDVSLLTMFLWIEQMYDIWLVPSRDGYIHVEKGRRTGDYGTMDPDMQYTYPLPYAFTAYNAIQVSYGEETSRTRFSLDLRTSTTEAKSQVTIDNPLVLTEAEAQAIAERVRSALYSAMVEVEWRTDALVDIGDSVGLTGRWSNESVAYDTVYQETIYDGSLTAHTRGTHK